MTMKRVILTVAAGLFLAVAVSAATGVDIKIVQKNKAFSTSALTIKAGDALTFVNADQGAHNVYAVEPGLAFDLRLQPPGSAGTVRFSRAGVANVACAIHPRMNL